MPQILLIQQEWLYWRVVVYTTHSITKSVHVCIFQHMIITTTHYILAVINKYKLNQLPNKKMHFGHFKVALLLKQALQSSSKPSSHSRQNKIQIGCQILTSFFTSACPSTMGPGDTKLAKEGKVNCLLIHLSLCWHIHTSSCWLLWSNSSTKAPPHSN